MMHESLDATANILSQDELEVCISASDGSEREVSPPEMPADLRLRLEEGPTKKHKGPQHSKANHDVQDLTGESATEYQYINTLCPVHAVSVTSGHMSSSINCDTFMQQRQSSVH